MVDFLDFNQLVAAFQGSIDFGCDPRAHESTLIFILVGAVSLFQVLNALLTEPKV